MAPTSSMRTLRHVVADKSAAAHSSNAGLRKDLAAAHQSILFHFQPHNSQNTPPYSVTPAAHLDFGGKNSDCVSRFADLFGQIDLDSFSEYASQNDSICLALHAVSSCYLPN